MATSDDTARAQRPRLAGLWAMPDFLKLWTGQTISELCSRITRDGLPLAALLVLGATPAQMGLLAATGALPALAFGLVAGVWVDRVRRRPLMIAADLARALLLFSVPAAAVLGRLTLPQLYLVVAAAAALTVFFDVAYRSYLPTLVGHEHVTEGNARLALSSATAEVLGPGLAGVLVQALTAPIAILFDALSFLVSAFSIGLIRAPEPPARPAAERAHALRESWQGLRFVSTHPLLRAFAGRAALGSFFGNFYAALYGLYAIRVLGLGPAALGVVIAIGGAGDLLGALLAERLGRRIPLGRLLVGCLAFAWLIGILTPLARGPVWLAALFLAVPQLFGDGAATIFAIHELSLRQAITPDRLLGRANASLQLLVTGVGPLGALAGGLLATSLGVRETLWVSAFGQLIALVWLALSPVRTLPTPPADAP